MNLLSPVSTIMIKDVITVPSNASIMEASKIFNERKFHHIPVVDDGKLVGILSQSDLAFIRRGFRTDMFNDEIARIQSYDFTVADFMTSRMATLDPDDKINVALEVFKENLFHAIPVTEGDRLVGIVTTYDIISNLADNRGAENTYENR